ncbi:MAG: hypothetical protein IV090_16470 [Candidatus Sericytochromatia bacterium]|nr:hypothetical protein [Candidatus Sericytochromatia bacterium]
MYNLNLDWQGDLISEVRDMSVRLATYQNQQPGEFVSAEVQGDRFQFKQLSSGSYLLCLRYQLNGRHFDSFYFQLDVPDTTQLKLQLMPQGALIDQMGFFNDRGELVDMLIYQGSKPFLTFAQEDHPYLASLSEFLAFRLPQLAAVEARQRLHPLLGDLAQALPMLSLLWPYQLKMLIAPALLAQTTAEWKACLMHLLRNNLILMDQEALHEILHEAVALTQEESRFQALLALMEWDSDTQDWSDYPGFLKQLAGQGMLKPARVK